jgi:transposase
LALAKHLYQVNQKVIVADPPQIHAFAKMEMARNMTDKADAINIARYYQYLFNRGEIDKTLLIPESAAFQRVKFFDTRLDQLSKMKSQGNDRSGVSLDKAAARTIGFMLTFIDKQIMVIKKEITITIRQEEQLTDQLK